MASESLSETYAVMLIATMMIGALSTSGDPSRLVAYPLVLGAVSIIASIIGTRYVKYIPGKKIMSALYRGLIVVVSLLFWLVGLVPAPSRASPCSPLASPRAICLVRLSSV